MELGYHQKHGKTSEDLIPSTNKHPTLHPENDEMELRATTTQATRALDPVHIEPREFRAQI